MWGKRAKSWKTYPIFLFSGSTKIFSLFKITSLQIIEPLTNGFRYSEGYDLFKDRLHLIPQAADDLKEIAQERLQWLDGQLEGKEYVCGDRLTLADIMLYCFLNFGKTVGQPIDQKNKNIVSLHSKLDSLDSASA